MINIAIIGCGYWGPNLIRNFYETDGVNLITCCDIQKSRLDYIRRRYPSIEVTVDYKDVLNNPKIDAVSIATPVSTHFKIGKEALLKGKHVLIEKPIADNSTKAKELVKLAKKMNKILMVDHVFIYSPAVRKIKEIIMKGELGDIYYLDSVRINLGLFQNDVNVIWDLASHDISIMDYLLDKRPQSVSATGSCHIGNNIENIAYIVLYYGNNIIAHIHVNWLAPVKIRTTLIGGSKKMIVYDDMEPSEKVKIYSKGINIKNDPEDRYNMLIDYREGDIYAPKIEHKEALKGVCEDFVYCINNKRKPIADGIAGLRVVEILEATQYSIKNSGKSVKL